MARSYKKEELDGYKFDSKSELEFYKILKYKKENGEILDFLVSPEYILQEGDWSNWRGEKQDSINHYPDYLVTLLNGEQIIIDTKGGGVSTHEPDAKVKKLIFEYLNREIPYYYISKLPLYLGGDWVESSPRHDFYTKLTTKYKKLFPKEVKKHWTEKRKFLPNEWGEYFEFENFYGLFGKMIKMYTKADLKKINKFKSK